VGEVVAVGKGAVKIGDRVAGIFFKMAVWWLTEAKAQSALGERLANSVCRTG